MDGHSGMRRKQEEIPHRQMVLTVLKPERWNIGLRPLFFASRFVLCCRLHLPAAAIASCCPQLLLRQGSFRGGIRGNAVSIVEKLPERTRTAFPLLKCLRTHYGRHCEPLSGQKFTTLQDFFHIHFQKFSGGNIFGHHQRSDPRCLDPDTNFRCTGNKTRRDYPISLSKRYRQWLKCHRTAQGNAFPPPTENGSGRSPPQRFC